MSDEYRLTLFNEDALKHLLAIKDTDEHWYVRLLLPRDEIVANGEPIPMSAKYNGQYGIVTGKTAFIRCYKQSGDTTIHLNYTNPELSIVFLGKMHENDDYNELIDQIDEKFGEFVILDLNDDILVEELREKDEDALNSIMDKLKERSSNDTV